ncbi:MAG: thiamine phosphate synthase [Bacteroidales bacterium]|nr:thiamine phosphate synthase [Bacteroidales bacterium]
MLNSGQTHAFALQFITNNTEPEKVLDSVRSVLDGGCRWVQLRMKDAKESDVVALAWKVKELCKSYTAVFVIDDYVEVCQQVDADGVHLGKNDMHPREARKILGDSKIIGGTCNTFDDILKVHTYVDYIGCGPFRYTTTKKNLAPVLGLEGYQEIVWRSRSAGINRPIVAIGGITIDDIPEILASGPNGIAMSGELLNAEDITLKTQQVVETIERAL